MKLRGLLIGFPVLACVGLFLIARKANPDPLRFDSNFESGAIRCRRCNPDGWREQNSGGQADALMVGSKFPKREGDYSLRVHADKDDPWKGSPRVELSGHAQPFFEKNKEYWVGWSIYLPADGGYEFDRQMEILTQVHGLNDSCDAGGMGPLHALRPIKGRWRWDIHWDPSPCMGSGPLPVIGEPEPAGKIIIDMGPQERGKWTDFVARFVFSHENDGITQVWRDGILVVDRVGMPNHYNNSRGPYIKFGFYKSNWLKRRSNVTTRTIYFDAIRVYEGTNGYPHVFPGGLPSKHAVPISALF